jgi:hypothetical protein
MKKRRRYIKAEECRIISMVAGNEKKFDKIIHNGLIKQWVGIGWVTEGPADSTDCDKYPIVK